MSHITTGDVVNNLHYFKKILSLVTLGASLKTILFASFGELVPVLREE